MQRNGVLALAYFTQLHTDSQWLDKGESFQEVVSDGDFPFKSRARSIR